MKTIYSILIAIPYIAAWLIGIGMILELEPTTKAVGIGVALLMFLSLSTGVMGLAYLDEKGDKL